MSKNIQRYIQESVPGKQVTLSHLIANPDDEMFEKLGIQPTGALGVLTITPSETVIIAGDRATKAANVRLGFLDRFTGSLVLVGAVSEVETALNEVNIFLEELLAFTPAKLTKS